MMGYNRATSNCVIWSNNTKNKLGSCRSVVRMNILIFLGEAFVLPPAKHRGQQVTSSKVYEERIWVELFLLCFLHTLVQREVYPSHLPAVPDKIKINKKCNYKHRDYYVFVCQTNLKFVPQFQKQISNLPAS
jgi:hypothetical protein